MTKHCHIRKDNEIYSSQIYRNTRWSVFLYAIMISFFAVIIGYIITIKMDTLMENFNIQNYDNALHANITEKWELAISYDAFLNSNGSGFIDTITCPNTVTMSGTLGGTLETIATSPFFAGNILLCSGSTSQGNLLVSYSASGEVFTTGSYLWSTISLSPFDGTGSRSGTFSDAVATALSFTATGVFSGIDINYNSDNFRVSSTGTIAYPNGWSDDDDMARQTLYGYVRKNTWWHAGLIINTPVRSYTLNNIFNTGSYGASLSQTQTGYIWLDVDNPYSIKIMEFDKTQFDTTRELRALTGGTVSSPTGGVGWITPDLSLTGSKATARVFDLQNKDYALFLSFSGNLTNTGVDFLKYKITAENTTGSGIYIVPIDDSKGGIFKYLGTDIIIDADGDYRYKQFEVIR